MHADRRFPTLIIDTPTTNGTTGTVCLISLVMMAIAKPEHWIIELANHIHLRQ
jgi:hypothetical protein